MSPEIEEFWSFVESDIIDYPFFSLVDKNSLIFTLVDVSLSDTL